MLMEYFDGYAQRYLPYKGGAWCYEDGCTYLGLERLYRQTGEARWIDHLIRLVDAQILPGPALRGFDPNEYNIDNILPGRALLFLHAQTGGDRYLEAAALLAGQLETHPRTPDGVYWHKLRYPWQVWLDGLYMGLPFKIGYGQHTGASELVDDALDQLAAALRATFVPATGLYAHAVDAARKQPWCDQATGHSRAHWSRALGWLVMALVDIADLVGPARFAPLRQQTEALLARLVELRQTDGLWLQVTDRPDLTDNYEESSASAMVVYGLLKAREAGLQVTVPAGLFDTLVARTLRHGPNGHVEMARICHVAGLGRYEDRMRDGSAEYYLSEAVVSDDPKGVGPLMKATAASLGAEGARLCVAADG